MRATISRNERAPSVPCITQHSHDTMSLTRFSERSRFLNLVWVGEDGGHRGQLPENRHNLWDAAICSTRLWLMIVGAVCGPETTLDIGHLDANSEPPKILTTARSSRVHISENSFLR